MNLYDNIITANIILLMIQIASIVYVLLTEKNYKLALTLTVGFIGFDIFLNLILFLITKYANYLYLSYMYICSNIIIWTIIVSTWITSIDDTSKADEEVDEEDLDDEILDEFED